MEKDGSNSEIERKIEIYVKITRFIITLTNLEYNDAVSG